MCVSGLSFPIVNKLVSVENDVYRTLEKAHALVVCTEWDEFKVKTCSFPAEVFRRDLFERNNLVSVVCKV